MSDIPLRLASYNLRKCVGLDRRRAPGRSLEVINALEADVMALQEADMRLGPRPAALPPAMIESYSDFTPVSLDRRGTSLGFHGNAVLVKDGLSVTSRTKINLPGLEPRGAVAVDLAGPAGGLRIVAVHLGLIRRYRLMQMRAIVEALSAMPALPTAILGDFNEWSTRRGMEPLQPAFRVHAPGPSFHAARPVAALDRVALGRGVHLIDAGVAETALSRRASDHLPVWADIRIAAD